MDIARTGKLTCAVVINDIGIANSLVNLGVKYVVFRPVLGVGDNHPAPFGDVRDILRGKAQWYNDHNINAHNQLDPAVYLQLQGHNEMNYLNDGYWYLGVQQGAPPRRRIALFGDGVGNPSDLRRDNQGHAVSEAWSLRVSSGCMRLGVERGDLACLHEYGRMIPVVSPTGQIVGMKETDDPGSAIWPDGHRDDGAYMWFGGRHNMVWRDIVPVESRMKILIGECGPSDAVYRGPGVLLSDMKGYTIRYRDDPYVVGFAYWTIGRGGGGTPGSPGDFTYSAFDSALPDILNWLK